MPLPLAHSVPSLLRICIEVYTHWMLKPPTPSPTTTKILWTGSAGFSIFPHLCFTWYYFSLVIRLIITNNLTNSIYKLKTFYKTMYTQEIYTTDITLVIMTQIQLLNKNRQKIYKNITGPSKIDRHGYNLKKNCH